MGVETSQQRDRPKGKLFAGSTTAGCGSRNAAINTAQVTAVDRPTPGPSANAPAAGQQSTIPDLRLYVGLVLKRSWVIASVFGVVFVGAVVYVSSLPSIYEATSKVVILTPAGQRYIGALTPERP